VAEQPPYSKRRILRRGSLRRHSRLRSRCRWPLAGLCRRRRADGYDRATGV